MLDKNSLASLSELKTAIVSSKDYGEGQVVGSNGRFGFVRLDDGRDAFLNPDKMQHVLPGDRVKISVIKNNKDQLEGVFEALITKGTKRFVGRYKSKGKACFVVPDMPLFNRWLFIPPQQRQHCKENDYVVGELTKHPYDDGKATAKIVARLGSDTEAFIEHKLTVAKHGLFRYWPKDCLTQAAKLESEAFSTKNRETLSPLPFVTIDGENTQDMDDAVHAEKTDKGWCLHVAIADPASNIATNSPIAKIAREYGQTVYLVGETLPMLPGKLATQTFSLLEGEERPTLTCRINIQQDGAVEDFHFFHNSIRSRKQLSYRDVAAFIDNNSPLAINDPEDSGLIETSLRELHALSRVRRTYREQNNLVGDDQTQYNFNLGKNGKIIDIVPQERDCAQRMIEEAMLLTNLCSGHFLAEHKLGIHTTHEGFRPERFGEVKALLKEELDGQIPDALETLDGFTAFMKELKNSPNKAYLLSPLKRMMSPSLLSNSTAPHMNMGFPHYATISSPIRRYNDLSNHWSITQILNKEKKTGLPASGVETLNATIDAGRLACRELEQWLKCQFTEQFIGQEKQGMIRVVTQTGFGVRLDDTGIEGFVQFGKNIDKQYDAKRMTLTVGETPYRLDEPVKIKIVGVDSVKRRVQFDISDATKKSVEAATDKHDLAEITDATDITTDITTEDATTTETTDDKNS